MTELTSFIGIEAAMGGRITGFPYFGFSRIMIEEALIEQVNRDANLRVPRFHSWEQLPEVLTKYDPDVILLELNPSVDAGDIVRKAAPDIPIVGAGFGRTSAENRIFKAGPGFLNMDCHWKTAIRSARDKLTDPLPEKLNFSRA